MILEGFYKWTREGGGGVGGLGVIVSLSLWSVSLGRVWLLTDLSSL